MSYEDSAFQSIEYEDECSCIYLIHHMTIIFFVTEIWKQFFKTNICILLYTIICNEMQDKCQAYLPNQSWYDGKNRIGFTLPYSSQHPPQALQALLSEETIEKRRRRKILRRSNWFSNKQQDISTPRGSMKQYLLWQIKLELILRRSAIGITVLWSIL